MEIEKNFMAKKINLKKFFQNKKILITGHTGFKGSWLSTWLLKFGCKVVGVSKNIPTKPSNFLSLNLNKKIKNYFIDIKNFNEIKKIIIKEKPDIIFHFAAQAIVSESFDNPIDTVNTNTIGSLNLLHTASFLKKKCICIMITSDKCYFNLEKNSGYKENSLLGGKDMYSGSKAAAEIILNAYFHSFSKKNKNLLFCTARAGNVIGGGDWSKNRLIPDIMRAWGKSKKAKIKNSQSIRPWQHVLEPLYGYMKAAYYLNYKKELNGSSFNFGPSSTKSYKVLELIKNLEILREQKKQYVIQKKKSFKETKILKLNSFKAQKKLKWKTSLNIKEMTFYISDWYNNFFNKKINMYNFTINQIKQYEKKIEKN